MINFDDYTDEDKAEYNLKWTYIPYHPYRILIIGGSWSGKTNALLNSINNQPDKIYFYKIYFYEKDLYEAKYQYFTDKINWKFQIKEKVYKKNILQKTTNLLENTSNQPSKFKAKNWVEINGESKGTYNRNSQIKFKTTMLKFSLCDYIHAHIFVKETITVPNSANKQYEPI